MTWFNLNSYLSLGFEWNKDDPNYVTEHKTSDCRESSKTNNSSKQTLHFSSCTSTVVSDRRAKKFVPPFKDQNSATTDQTLQLYPENSSESNSHINRTNHERTKKTESQQEISEWDDDFAEEDMAALANVDWDDTF